MLKLKEEVGNDKVLLVSVVILMTLLVSVPSIYIYQNYDGFNLSPESEFECQPKSSTSLSVFTRSSPSMNSEVTESPASKTESLSNKKETMESPYSNGNTLLITPPSKVSPWDSRRSKRLTQLTST